MLTACNYDCLLLWTVSAVHIRPDIWTFACMYVFLCFVCAFRCLGIVVGRNIPSFTNSPESSLSFSFVGAEKFYSGQLLEKLAVVHFVSCIIIIIINSGCF